MTTRTLHRLTSAFALCEFGTEDEECPLGATWVLNATRSYSVPIYLCDEHAAQDALYCGSVYR